MCLMAHLMENICVESHEAVVYAHDSFLGDNRLRVSPWQPRQTEELLVHVSLADDSLDE